VTGQVEPPPHVLRLALSRPSDDIVAFAYETERGDRGTLTLRYPFSDPAIGAVAPTIGLGVAAYLGQLCLAPRIELSFATPAGAVEDFRPLAQMLYDVRRWKDDLPLGDPPEIVTAGTTTSAPVEHAADATRALLLWSGGKDSTLSALLLQRNGYDVAALHATVNAGVEDVERAAVSRLAAGLRLRPATLGVSHPEFLSLSSRYARSWNRFPLCNTVPFGRDLLLALAAVPAAAHFGAAWISFGHDHDCRAAMVSHPLRNFPRNDVESILGATALEWFVRTHIFPRCSLLPPLAGLPELRILHDMLVHHPDRMALTSFCFWGNACGRCAKCLRYSLAQRLLIPHRPVLRFRVDPLADRACPELDHMLSGVDVNGLLFQRQVLWCLGRLCLRDDRHGSTDALRRFERMTLPVVLPHLDAWEDELLADHGDPQVPLTFVTDVWGPPPPDVALHYGLAVGEASTGDRMGSR
jgi:7-cyano-7-deazaguanine synthase in queuosine biosynthesis